MLKFAFVSLSAVTAVSVFSGVTASAADAGYNCDGVIRRLMQSQCTDGTCGINIVSGKVFNVDKSNPAETDGSSTSIRKLDNGKLKSTVEGMALESVKVDRNADGTRKLTMEHRTAAGLMKSEYTFDASDEYCALIEKATKAPGEKMKVDYDRKFCATASNAFMGMGDAEAQRCADVVRTVADAYQKRSAELAKNDRSFRESQPVPGLRAAAARAANGDGPIQNVALEAMRQRDRCVQASTDVNGYRPMKLDLIKLMNGQNGAWLGESLQMNNTKLNIAPQLPSALKQGKTKR